MVQWKKTNHVLKFIGKASGSVLLGLVLLEVGLRITGRCPPPPPLLAELSGLDVEAVVARAAQEAWIHPPSTKTVLEQNGDRPETVVRRDWCGCREDQDTPLHKPAGVYRILVQGDSHTDGFVENEDSYANVLERLLGNQVDVMNGGQAVSSPYQQLWIYRVLYRRFSPDLLVIGFYAGNDLLELMLQDDRIHLERSGREYVHADRTWRPDLTRERSPWKTTLHRHLAICRAAEQLKWLQLDHQRKRDLGFYYEPLIEAKELYPGAVWQGLNQAYYFKHHPDDWLAATDMFRFVLEEFQRDAPPDGMLVIIIPTFRQLRPEAAAEAVEILQLSTSDRQCDERACEVAVDLCQQLGIPVLDMRPTMKRFAGDLYWSADRHINTAAHRLIAEQLAARFQPLHPPFGRVGSEP